MASKLLTIFLFLQSFFFSLSVSSLTSVSSACEVLSDSGYFSMGLTLELATKDLNLQDYQELTIFAPSDQAFSRFGQPSLLDLKLHLSPTRFLGETLSKIPTLRSNSSLFFTNNSRSGGVFWINDVPVQDSPVFDDGFVVIYGSDEFFSSLSSLIPNLVSSPESVPILSSANRNAPVSNFALSIFESTSSFLMRRGLVLMATFLALQLQSSEDEDEMIVPQAIEVSVGESLSEVNEVDQIKKSTLSEFR